MAYGLKACSCHPLSCFITNSTGVLSADSHYYIFVPHKKNYLWSLIDSSGSVYQMGKWIYDTAFN